MVYTAYLAPSLVPTLSFPKGNEATWYPPIQHNRANVLKLALIAALSVACSFMFQMTLLLFPRSVSTPYMFQSTLSIAW